MNYPTFGLGHDFGNSETCAIVTGQNQIIERRIPSVSAIGSWARVVATAKGSGSDTISVSANHYILEYSTLVDGETRTVQKYIGQKVFDDGMTPLQTIGDSSRYWVNNYNLEMLMVAAGSIIPYPEFGLYVCTGLPISVYLDDSANADRVREALIGTHEFYLNGQRRIMHVENVKVIMEGAGALIAYGSRESVLQGVIDIGGQTTDLFAAMGQKPRPAMCEGIPMGVAAAAERLAEKFRQNYGYTPSLEVLKDLMQQHVHGYEYRTVRDKRHAVIPSTALKPMIESSLREIGQEIATAVMRVWGNVEHEFERVQVVGGGAHYFTQDIQSRMAHVVKARKPGMANAQGYNDLATALMERARAAQR